jgi:NADH-quinone oxidoreductase subunit C
MTTPTDFAAKLKEKFGELVSEPTLFRDEVTVRVFDSGKIDEICSFLKKEHGFDYLVDISSLDHYGEEPRFSVVYELYGYGHRCHLRLRTDVTEEKAELPTVSKIWRTANWHEREIYDMMGIRFSGHPDLRRILMWEGYPYFPLRKDFPLAGRPTELPDVAFTAKAPLEGGPFVTLAGGKDAMSREPRVRTPEEETVQTISRLERRHDVVDSHKPNPAPK